MTTWTNLPDKIAGDAVTFEDWNAVKDNPDAIAEGDPSAPAISPAALRWICEEIFYDSITAGNLVANGSGSFTWTCPASVTACLAEAIGGGGGGGGGGEDSAGSDGAAGGDTTFDFDTDEVIGNGGGGGGGGTSGGGGAAGVGASVVTADVDTGIAGLNGVAGTRTGATPQNGGAGATRETSFDYWPGGAGGIGDDAPGSGALNFGCGGGGGGSGGTGGVAASGGGGGGGSWGRKVGALVPGNTYAIQIGAGGNGGNNGTGGGGGAGGTHRAGADGTGSGNDGGGGGGGGAGKMILWYRKP